MSNEQTRPLQQAIDHIEQTLEQYIAYQQGDAPDPAPFLSRQNSLAKMTLPPSLVALRDTLNLSPFACHLLLLCAGIELRAPLATLCALAQGNPQMPYPTFNLALNLFPEPLWSDLLPTAPLRYWRLIDMAAPNPLAYGPLRLDERILHYLLDWHYLDERLRGIITPLPSAETLVPSHQTLAKRLTTAWEMTPNHTIQLCGGEANDRQAIASTSCQQVGWQLCALSLAALPTAPAEVDALQRLWQREAILNGQLLLIAYETEDVADPARHHALQQFIEASRTPLVISSSQRQYLGDRPVVTVDVHKPTTAEQRLLWQQSLPAQLNGHVEQLVAQFDLNRPAIRSACASAQPARDDQTPATFATELWDACRRHTRPRLDDLAQRIDSRIGWEDLILPAPQQRMLQEVATHVRQRLTVYETWGVAGKSQRGLGVSALFAGPSGTGKTTAAEALAHELRLDLYRIDLSGVVSKYIGETEKNLRRVFEAAEAGGAILLFDEADALFGKRSDVKDSHDRYANIEVSYLLQQMESYRGLAILTTNMKDALDNAFLRRIRFVVQFPFPDVAQRTEIWRRAFPPDMPTQGLQIAKLAKLNIAGGNIRNIVLHAAFLAAEAGQPVQMSHLLRAARVEYAKLERTLTAAEIGGWV